MSKPCVNGHANPKRNRHHQCLPCKSDVKKRLRAERVLLNATKKRGWRGYHLTNKARRALRPTFLVGVNDHSPKCTCGDCVMRRLRKDGKLARRAKAAA